MSTENSAQPDTPAAGGGKKTILVAAVVAVLAGGGGAFLAAPVMAKKVAAEIKATTPADGEHAEEKPEAPGVSHSVENLVLNPANSGGMRFLMVSVAFDLKDAAAAETLKARDAEVRDALIQLMGAKTVEELANPGTREALKAEILASVGALLDKGAVRRIYLPQFVIQ